MNLCGIPPGCRSNFSTAAKYRREANSMSKRYKQGKGERSKHTLLSDFRPKSGKGYVLDI